MVDDADATGIAINRNNLQGLDDGISTNATATVDGTCNWWGAASGPTPGQIAGGGPLTTSPWLFSNNLLGSVLRRRVGGHGHQRPRAHVRLDRRRHGAVLGLNSNGQLGDGTTTQRLSPVVVKNSTNTGPLTGITQIVAGGTHTCARLSDGTARCWGKNSNGQLGDGTTTQRLLPVVVKNPAGSGSLTNVSQLSLAVIYSCTRIGDGTVRCWGNNSTRGARRRHADATAVAGHRKEPGGHGLRSLRVTQISVRGIHSCPRISDADGPVLGLQPQRAARRRHDDDTGCCRSWSRTPPAPARSPASARLPPVGCTPVRG